MEEDAIWVEQELINLSKLMDKTEAIQTKRKFLSLQEEVILVGKELISLSNSMKELELSNRSKLMDEMSPTKLFYRDLGGYFRKWWVFWSHNKSEISSINCDLQDRIKTALYCLTDDLQWLFSGDLLVQFWAPEEIEGQLHLTTTLQPFALSNIYNEKLREYRKHCAGYKLLVQDEKSAGIVGRVFRNQLHETGRDLKGYSVRDYPQRDFVLSCGFSSTFVLPVFEHSSENLCVGVLELLAYDDCQSLVSLYNGLVLTALKEQHLRTIDMVSFRNQIIYDFGIYLGIEIKTAVQQVCNIYNLPHGVTWFSSKHICSEGELLAAIPELSYARVETFLSDVWGLWLTPLRVNQGLVGKVFSSHNLHFCRDICQLSITEYPFVNEARNLGVAAGFAFCLRNISTGNNELVIEFSLSREGRMTYGRDLHSFFSSIMATMSQKLKSFEVVTGDMENEIFTEVPTQREESDNDFTSFKAISTPTTSEGDSSQSLRTTECSMNNTCRQSVWPYLKRANESDQFIPESSSRVKRTAQRAESERSGEGNSETASTEWVNVFGFTVYANQPDISRLNQSTREISSPPLSEASSIYADVEMITNVELMTIKVSYGKDIIKFDLPPSSSYADLMENILNRWGFLKDNAFVIKYLNVSHEPILLATDMDLQECMVRTRSRGNNPIRMVIQLEEVVP